MSYHLRSLHCLILCDMIGSDISEFRLYRIQQYSVTVGGKISNLTRKLTVWSIDCFGSQQRNIKQE